LINHGNVAAVGDAVANGDTAAVGHVALLVTAVMA